MNKHLLYISNKLGFLFYKMKDIINNLNDSFTYEINKIFLISITNLFVEKKFISNYKC